LNNTTNEEKTVEIGVGYLSTYFIILTSFTSEHADVVKTKYLKAT